MPLHKTIGIDMDDVLIDFNESLFRYHNEKFGTNYKREDATTYKVEDLWGYTVEKTRELLNDFYYSDHHNEALPVEGAIEAIEHLSKNNSLHIVTARPSLIKSETHVWIDKHFKDSFKDIHFTCKDIFDQDKRMKSDICKELGIELFIEDSLENAMSIAGIGIPVFLIDTPWNQGELHPLVTRVKTWKEIIEKI